MVLRRKKKNTSFLASREGTDTALDSIFVRTTTNPQTAALFATTGADPRNEALEWTTHRLPDAVPTAMPVMHNSCRGRLLPREPFNPAHGRRDHYELTHVFVFAVGGG